MSVIGDIVAAVIVDVKAAVPGIDTESENIPLSALTTQHLPHVRVIGTEFESELLDFRQELHRWSIELQLVQQHDTRESLELKVEAIRDQVFADPTLGSTVDRARMESSVPHSQADAEKLSARIVVIAEKVKS